MKLDGEKLLADLSEYIKLGNDSISDLIVDKEWSEVSSNAIAIETLEDVVNLIKSGDYTIKDKG